MRGFVVKKYLFCWLGIIFFCLALFRPPEAKADPLETERECSLTISYAKDDLKFADLEISIDRVAKALEDGTFEKITPFTEYPVSIYDRTSKEDWKSLAVTLSSYIKADALEAYQSKKTDKNGTAVFEELETGLYLVRAVTAKAGKQTCVFEEFMLYLPAPLEDGTFSYEVQAKPKGSSNSGQPVNGEYKVVKLWKDSAAAEERPESVTVEILKDGELEKTAVLNAENNWSYSWKVSETDSEWSVVEKDVTDSYTVSVTEKDGSFVLTNTHKSSSPGGSGGAGGSGSSGSSGGYGSYGGSYSSSPKTGDTSPLWLYIMLMCISGWVLVILGTGGLRGRRNADKK